MNDVVASKRSSIGTGLVEAAMFLKLNISSILNNPIDIVESPIWNTLISSCPELPYDIDDSDDNENEEDDIDNDDEDDDLSLVLVENEEADYTC